MRRIVDVNRRSGWFRGKFRIRCPGRRCHRCQRGVVGYRDECRRFEFIRDPGLHVG
jgi:hypothetical protein